MKLFKRQFPVITHHMSIAANTFPSRMVDPLLSKSELPGHDLRGIGQMVGYAVRALRRLRSRALRDKPTANRLW